MQLMESAPVDLAAADARELTDRIKLAVEATWHLIADAYTRRAWSALGYSSWDDYCTREFGTSRLRLPREERGEVVASLREQGLSIRAIASATGEGVGTVARALAGVPNGTPDEASAIRDALDDDELAGPTTVTFDEAVEAAEESRRIPEPRPIVGTDGKSYPAAPRTPQPVPKPSVADGVPPHPATYPAAVLDIFRDLIPAGSTVLDPFAGVGTIHQLRPECDTYGIELEAEWAAASPFTMHGDARHAGDLFGEQFDVIATSPAYGNRLADWYRSSDPEARRSYAIDLGHELTDGNGAGLHFDTDGEYERLHEEVWEAVVRLLRPDGLFLLNCKDFVRDRQVMPVTGWHLCVLADLGLQVFDLRCLPAAGLPMTTAKPISELVVVLRKVGSCHHPPALHGGRGMSAPRPCPHCGDQHPTGWHLRDAGDIPAAVAITAGYCPTLAHRRGAR